MFEVGKQYHRSSEIHDVYGGQRQGGISTPANSPDIFIFTSQSGEQYGYQDEFVEGVFWYTGEGQSGPMQMKGGNKAILEHAQNAKTIHVFEYTRKAYVRYVGRANYIGHHETLRPDMSGAYRQAIIFHLDIDSTGSGSEIASDQTPYKVVSAKSNNAQKLSVLREKATAKPSNLLDNLSKQQVAYRRSEALKKYILLRSEGICEGCKNPAPFKTKQGPYLECHHLHRLCDGGPDAPENVIALCPNCHRRAHYADDNYNEMLKPLAVEQEIMALKNIGKSFL